MAARQNQVLLTAVAETWPKPRWPKLQPGRKSFQRQFRRRNQSHSRNSVGLYDRRQSHLWSQVRCDYARGRCEFCTRTHNELTCKSEASRINLVDRRSRFRLALAPF